MTYVIQKLQFIKEKLQAHETAYHVNIQPSAYNKVT